MTLNNSPRRTRQEWHKLISEQELSGQTQSNFCRERGISLSALNNARNRLRNKPDFIEVSPVEITRVQSWTGEVVFPNGVTVRVRG